MIVKIKRQDRPDSAPFWQSCVYDGSREVTVAAVLDYLNYNDDLTDTEGHGARRIRWECSCLQKVCGACAMVINRKPGLACAVFLRDLPEEELTLEPLSKFPVIADLQVDRSVIYRNLQRAQMYLRQYRGGSEKEYPHQYQAAKCLKCGLCLEVCPNYTGGEDFFGALFANEAYLLSSQSEEPRELRREYGRHFAAGCSRSLACESICPAGIPTLASIAKMNRGKFGK